MSDIISTEQQREQEELRNSNDFLLNTSLGGKSSEDLLEEGYLPEDFALLPKEEYLENEQFQGMLEENDMSVEQFDQVYDETVAKFNDFQEYADTSIEGVVAREIAKGSDNFKHVTNRQHIYDVLTPQEMAVARGYWDEEELEYKNIEENSIEYLFGKGDTYKVEQTEAGFELDVLDPKEGAGHDDMIIKATNIGALGKSFLNADRKNESFPAYFARNVLRTVPYFIPYVNVAMAAKDVAQGVGTLGRTIAKANGSDAEGWNKYNAFFKRGEIGMNQTVDASSLQSIVGNVAEIIQQVKGMQVAYKGTAGLVKGVSKHAGAIGKSGFTAKRAAYASVSKTAGFGQKAGSFVGRFSMAAPPSGDMALLAEHNGIDPKHALALQALTFAGYMQLGKISEKFFKPAEFNTIARSANQKLLKSVGPKLAQTKFTIKTAGKTAKLFEQNAKATLERMAALKSKSPQVYKVLLGAMNEGLEEVGENAMEDILIKGGYNLINSDKEAGNGRFKDFNSKQFIREAGISFAYGALAGGLMGSSIGAKLLQNEDNDTVMTYIQMAQDPETRKRMDAYIAKEGRKEYGSKSLSMAKDKDGKFRPVNPQSPDSVEQISQNRFNHKNLQAEWERAKDIADGGKAVQRIRGMSHSLRKEFEEFTENEELTMIHRSSAILTQIEELKGKRANLESDESPETKQKLEKINEQIAAKEKEHDYLASDEHLKTLAKETLYQFSPLINVDQNGQKIKAKNADGTDNPDYMTLDQFNELRAAYDGMVDEYVKGNKEELQNTIKTLPSGRNIAEVMATIGDKPVTSEVLEDVKKLYEETGNELTQNFRETLLQALHAKFSPNIPIDKSQKGIAKQYGNTVANIISESGIPLSMPENWNQVDSEIKEHLPKEINTILNAISSQKKELQTQYSNFKPRVIDPVGRMEALMEIMLSDQDGQSLSSKLEEEEAAANIVPIKPGEKDKRTEEQRKKDKENQSKEYASIAPDAMAIPLSHHIQYLNTLRVYNTSVADFNNRSERELKSPEEIQMEQNLYDKMYGKMINYYQRLNSLISLAKSNSVAGPEALDENNKKVLSLRVERMTDLISHIFADPKYKSNNEELQAELLDIANNEELPFEEARRRYYKAQQAIYDFFSELPQEAKEEFMKTNFTESSDFSKGSEKKTLGRLNLFMTITAVDPKKFAHYMAAETELLGDTAPVFMQEIALQETYAYLYANATRNTLYTDTLKSMAGSISKENASKVLENAYVVQGSRGAGKTTYIASLGGKMIASTISDEQLSKSDPAKVVAAGPQSKQQEKLRESLKAQGVKLSTENGIDSQKLITDLENGADYLAHTGILMMYDEATWIPQEDVLKINQALKEYNEKHRKNQVPLQMLYIGDPFQLGHVERTQSGGFRESNITGLSMKFESSYVNMSLRAKNDPLESVMNKHILRRLGITSKGDMSVNEVLRTNEAFEAKWGRDNNGRLAGMRVVNTKENPDDLQSAIDSILAQKDTSFAYITERPKEEFPEELRKYVYSITEVQGREFDGVVVDLPNYMVKFSGKATIEEQSLKTLGVAIGRATEFVTVVNNTNRAWSSVESTSPIIEAFSILNPDTLSKITPIRRNNIQEWAAEMNGTTTESGQDGKGSTTKLTRTPLMKEVDLTSIKDLQPFIGPVFDSWLENNKKYNQEIDEMEKDLQEALNQINDPESSDYKPDETERNKLKEEQVKSFEKAVFEVQEEFQQEFDKVIKDAWDQALKAISELDFSEEPTKIVDGKKLSPKQAYAHQIISQLSEESILKSIPNLLDVVAERIKLPGISTPLNPPGNRKTNYTLSESIQWWNSLSKQDKSAEKTKLDARYTILTEAREKGILDETFKEVIPAKDRKDTKIKVPKDDKSFYNFTIKPDMSVVYTKSGKPAPERLARLALLISGKVPYKTVTLDDGREYAMTEGKGTIINITKKSNGTYHKSAGTVLSPESGEMQLIKKKLIQEPSETDVRNSLEGQQQSESKYLESVFSSGALPVFTWLNHDFNNEMTPREMYDLKQEIINNPSKYEFVLRTGNILDLEDAGVDIKFPDKLHKLSGGRVAYIEVKWGEGKRMVFGVMPYVSPDRLAKNKVYEDINKIIMDKEFEGLNITDEMRNIMLPRMRGTFGRMHVNDTPSPYIELIQNHQDDNKPRISFSKKVFIYKLKGKSKLNGKPFVFYSNLPQEEHDILVERYADKKISLERMRKKGVGILTLNHTIIPKFSQLISKFGSLDGNGYTVHGEKLLSKKVSKAIALRLIEAYNSSSVDQKVKDAILKIINSTNVTRKGKKVDLSLYEGKLVLIDEYGVSDLTLKDFDLSLDIVGIYQTLYSTISEDTAQVIDSIVNSVKAANGYKMFSRGIMLDTKMKAKPQNSSNQLIESAEGDPAIIPTNSSENALISDPEVLSLYETTVTSISSPNTSMDKDFLSELAGKLNMKRSEEDEIKRKLAEKQKREAERKNREENIRKEILRLTKSKDTTKQEIQLLINQIEASDISDSFKQEAIEYLKKDMDKRKPGAIIIPTYKWMGDITKHLEQNKHLVIGEDFESSVKAIAELLTEFQSIDPSKGRIGAQRNAVRDGLKKYYKGSMRDLTGLMPKKIC